MTHQRIIFALLAILATVSSQPVLAQQAPTTDEQIKALRQEVKELKEGQAAIQKKLETLQRVLQGLLTAIGPPAPKEPESVSIAGHPFLGNKDASVVLVDFSDYQCPFCGRFFRDTMPQLQRDYIQTGKVKYVFRDFPLTIHPNALKAAEAAQCAGDQGKFWEMHFRLFQNQQALELPNLSSYAVALGLDQSKFNQCLQSGKYAATIQKDMEEGGTAGIEGTPSFLIASLDQKGSGNSNLRVLKMITGSQPYSVFKAALDEALHQ